MECRVNGFRRELMVNCPVL